jgi:hypothetical protein
MTTVLLRHVLLAAYDVPHTHLCLFPLPVASSLPSIADTCTQRSLCSAVLSPVFDGNSRIEMLSSSFSTWRSTTTRGRRRPHPSGRDDGPGSARDDSTSTRCEEM